MTGKKRPFEQAAKEIDAGLGGLMGALNEAIGEMMTRLDDGTSGTVERNHTFQSPKGPVRAHAGIRLRMGGMEVGGDEPDPTPVNPDRPQSPSKPAPRDLSFDVISDEDSWVLTADVPGVSRKDVQLSRVDTVLQIKTFGTRQYAGSTDLGANFDVDAAQVTLRNGILTLRIPKGGAG